MNFLENHFVILARIIWAITYCVLLSALNFVSIYQLTGVVIFIFFILGVYWLSKVLTTAIVLTIAKVFALDVDIEYSTQLRVDNKDI